MGGRLDATNAVQSSVSVITPIDFDHEKWLGHSLGQIAREKAGIIKPRIPVVSAPQRAEAEVIIRQRAEECDARLQFVNDPWTKTRIALRGKHQKMNAALAFAALQATDIQVSDDAIARGVFGVPSMEANGEIFWGYDDLPYLELFLAGDDPLARTVWGRADVQAPRPSAMRRQHRARLEPH